MCTQIKSDYNYSISKHPISLELEIKIIAVIHWHPAHEYNIDFTYC